ncbi:MAG: hypothetical protein A2X64_02640 [Ignavibacteria bacterium GWF2_33_9]|nr:MAG: hypothetical protein A2X64_02640 [Ignavibacteria bacterium GWF2_33_9]
MTDSFKFFFLEKYLGNLQNIFEQKNIDKKINYSQNIYEVINLFFDFLKYVSSLSKQTFPTNFARWVFIIDKYNIKFSNSSFLKVLYQIKKKIKAKKRISKAEYEQIFENILQISKFILSKIKFNKEYLYNLENEELFVREFHQINFEVNPKQAVEVSKNLILRINKISGILINKRISRKATKDKILVCTNQEIGEFFVLLNEGNEYLFDLEINTNLNFENLKIHNIDKNAFIVTDETLVICQPDFLFDITEISECITPYGPYISKYFLKLFEDNISSIPLIQGTLVNTIFDELILNPNIDFETSFRKAIKIRPLKLLPLFNKQNSIELTYNLQQQYNSISQNLLKFPKGLSLIEPSFLSSFYGLQGRLDLLIEFPEDQNRKDIIELKSGKPPSSQVRFPSKHKTKITNTWPSHTAQANGYNLLLDSIYENRTGSSSIFYSSDSTNGFRNVSNVKEFKSIFLETRNKIYIKLSHLLTNKQSLIDIIVFEEVSDKLINSQKTKFLQRFNNLSYIERHYYKTALEFILKEDYNAKISDSSNCQSNLWNDTFEDKLENFSIIPNLRIASDSDFDFLHLKLILENENIVHFFRKGDSCLIYPMEHIDNPTQFYILKGFIKEINSEEIVFSIMNKDLDANILKRYYKWALEVDRSNSLIKKQTTSLFSFFDAERERRDLVFGFMEPTSTEKEEINFDYLNEYQTRIVNKIIQSNEYYLLQGPPGTGKTSRILRALIDYYFNSTESKVLICAYTNRAVDEICSTLDKIQVNFPFIRISGKELENYYERSIPALSNELTLSGLKKEIKNTRFFVSTVTSIHLNTEIFDLVNFDLIIVDEASQVLETQLIGIIIKAPKFVLIGDEKQLPAIVQIENHSDNILQKKISLNSFTDSLFSRLIRIAKINDWKCSFGTLINQGRMHEEIQQLSNFLVYNETLQSFNMEWQTNDVSPYFIYKSEFDSIFCKRVVFINTPLQNENKYHTWEANFISRIIDFIYKNNQKKFSEKTVGVIAPYRLQCRSIIDKIPLELRNTITVDTVERFQGSERDIILISFATNYDFLLSNLLNETLIDERIIDRKLNVALTRAKENLILFGNESILSKSKIYKAAINWIKVNGIYIDYSIPNSDEN